MFLSSCHLRGLASQGSGHPGRWMPRWDPLADRLWLSPVDLTRDPRVSRTRTTRLFARDPERLPVPKQDHVNQQQLKRRRITTTQKTMASTTKRPDCPSRPPTFPTMRPLVEAP